MNGLPPFCTSHPQLVCLYHAHQWAGSDMSCIWESVVSLRVYPMGFEKWAEQLLHVVRTDWLSALPVPRDPLFIPLMLTCPGPLLSLHFPLSHRHLFRVTPCGASLNRFLSLDNSYLSPSCLFITWEVLSCQPNDAPFSRGHHSLSIICWRFWFTFKFEQLWVKL